MVVGEKPLADLNPKGARQVKTMFRDLYNAGTALFIPTPSIGIAETVCELVCIIHRGTLIDLGAVEELRKKYRGSIRIWKKYFSK